MTFLYITLHKHTENNSKTAYKYAYLTFITNILSKLTVTMKHLTSRFFPLHRSIFASSSAWSKANAYPPPRLPVKYSV